MIRWVSGVVQVTPQATWGRSIVVVKKEKGEGSASPDCISSTDQSMVEPSRRAGVPVYSRPMERPRP